MRVTHFIGADQPRGAEVAARSLVEVLAATAPTDRHRIVSLVGHQTGSAALGVDAVLVAGVPRAFTTPRAMLAARRELRGHPADVILAHGTHAALVATIARTRGTRVVWQRILHLASWPRRHPNRLWLRWLARHVDGVVAITPRTGEEVRALGFRGPVWQIPNHRPRAPFADLDRTAAGARLRSDLGLAPDTPLLGFVGHLVPQKQPVHAVEALRLLLERWPNAHLVVVGDGPQRARVQAAVDEAGISGSVTCLGHRSDVPSLLAGLDLLVLPSREDSMPGVAVEAQLAGCPVVAYPVDGIEMAIEVDRTGMVTSSADPAAMVASIVWLLDEPRRRDAMVVAALERSTQLTTEASAPRYLGVLRTMVGRPGSGADPLRVAHVLPDLGVGGAERALDTFAAHRRPDEVTAIAVVVSGARRPLEETVLSSLARHDVPYCDLGVRGRPTRSPLALLAARHRLQVLAGRLELDVLDAALLDAALPARLTSGRWRRVTHLVNTPWEPVVRRRTDGRRWRRATLMRIDRWSARRDDATVAISAAVARSAARHLHLDGVTVIPRGVDLDAYRPASHRTAAGTGPVRLVSVGRLVPQKGHDVVIRAVAAARSRGVDVTLSIIGEGPEWSALDSLVDGLGLGAVAHLHPPVVDVRPALHGADAFVLASRWEGQSNAVLEAMACGLPVLVSELGVFREVVADAGDYAPPDEPVAWATAIARLAADPALRSQLGAAARARVAERYDASRRTADLVALYRTICGSGEVGGPTAAWYVAPVAMEHEVDEVTDSDRSRVEVLLGRPTAARFDIVARGDDGRPLVIRNDPFLDDGTPMPTRYWLVDPSLRARIGTIESLGGVRQAEAEIDPVELQAAHDRYAAERDAAIPGDHTGPRPSGGVGGTRRGVKCLHTHYAYLLAGGDDPVGRWVATRLAAVPPEGAVNADG